MGFYPVQNEQMQLKLEKYNKCQCWTKLLRILWLQGMW